MRICWQLSSLFFSFEKIHGKSNNFFYQPFLEIFWKSFQKFQGNIQQFVQEYLTICVPNNYRFHLLIFSLKHHQICFSSFPEVFRTVSLKRGASKAVKSLKDIILLEISNFMQHSLTGFILAILLKRQTCWGFPMKNCTIFMKHFLRNILESHTVFRGTNSWS